MFSYLVVEKQLSCWSSDGSVTICVAMLGYDGHGGGGQVHGGGGQVLCRLCSLHKEEGGH